MTMIPAVASAQHEEGEMAQPLDPVALGVASALKSLRTRAGLQEERLRGTELELDTLNRLDSVQALVSAGEDPERAIVRVVRAAAGTLDPTMSIVADASLRLRLFAEQVPDGDLYAEDLGQRREAVLRNWDRLHALRSAPPGKLPSPRSLRLEVEAAALAALAVALTPDAGSAASAMPPAKPLLLQTFRNVAKALRESLTKGVDGRPGWQHDLRRLPGEPTAVSTAYGIRAMMLLEDGLAADLIPVAENLKTMAYPGGGYASRGQSGPRAESTAVVLNALRRISATEDFDAHIGRMERDLGEFEKTRPFILTTMLETSLLLGPESGLVQVLVDSLLAVRQPRGDFLLWPEKKEIGLIDPAPSVAHTARAIRVLADVQAIRPASQIEEALDQSVPWLTEQSEKSDLHNTYEFIERFHDRSDSVRTEHFTAAWVVKALVSAGVPATHPSVSKAVNGIWDSYRHDTAALWRWDNGDLPIWMTFDAIEALRLAHLAVPAGPG